MYLENIHIEVKNDALIKKFQTVVNDDQVCLQLHNLFAKEMDPFVPMDNGHLAQSVEVTKDYVRYPGPYAHYQYVGIVYGPNIPMFDETGNIVGWWSPPGKPKNPTGRSIVYSTSGHPLASKEWDKAMLETKGEDFRKQVKEILVKKAVELYG